jgi:hypothetical protein
MTESSTRRAGGAWLLLCGALALHVVDEAATGFLSVYNPSAMAIRARAAWLPVPVFGFWEWLLGLTAAVMVLTGLSWFVFRGDRWIRALGCVLAIVMIANALGHTLGTIFGRTVEGVTFARPMPGFYSSPLLLAASVYLLYALRRVNVRAPRSS